MIKLQLLLRHPRPDPQVDPALRALLEAHGITLTGEGRASLSATVSEEQFRQLFGAPQIEAGFAARPYEPPALPIPAPLADAISLITVAPRHATMTTETR